MVRSEFYNGAISFWVNILSLYWLEALSFLFDEQIHLMMNPYWCFITQIFSEMTHRPYILEFYIYIINILYSFSFFLSSFHLSIPFLFDFDWQLRLEIFLIKKISVATTIWPIYHILTGSLDPDNTKWWVGYYFYSYLFILWGWFFILTLKKPTSHTLSIAILSKDSLNFY